MIFCATLAASRNICKYIFLFCCYFFSMPVAACDQPVIIFPAQHADISSGRPVISWLPVNEATGYEITIQSRIPEGEVVAQFTTAIYATKFIPPTFLTRERAVVSARVKAKCGADGVSVETERVFFIDVRSTCPPPAGLTRESVGSLTKISWEANPLFEEVEVRLFGNVLPGLLERVPKAQNFAVISASTEPESIVGVRSVCKEAIGAWGWLR